MFFLSLKSAPYKNIIRVSEIVIIRYYHMIGLLARKKIKKVLDLELTPDVKVIYYEKRRIKWVKKF